MRLDDHLGDPFGGSKNGDRIGRFVSRDEDEVLDTGGDRRLHQVPGSEHVGFDAFAWMALEQW